MEHDIPNVLKGQERFAAILWKLRENLRCQPPAVFFVRHARALSNLSQLYEYHVSSRLRFLSQRQLTSVLNFQCQKKKIHAM